MKRTILLCVTLLLVLTLAAPALAVQTDLLDGAGLLTSIQCQAVEVALSQTAEQLDMDVVIVTTDSLDGMSARRYAESYYDDHGYADTGVLLLVCMAEREYWITTTGRISLDLDGLEDEFVFLLSSAEYEQAFLSFAQELPYYLSEDMGGENSIVPVLLVCVGIGLLSALIATLVMKSQLKSVRAQRAANSYMVADSFQMTHSRDIFLYRNISRSPRPKSNSSSASSGRSHGGGGGRF